MLSIGNKKYRNLQEQVAYNTECIEELDKAIDGITLEDKLVIIANDSGTFTEEEMTVLNGPLAFISDGSKVWLKQSETASEFVFKAIDIVATEQGGTHYNVGGTKIVVTRATRAYVTSDDVIIVTYNKSQIDSLLALKADLSGADFTGAVTAQTLSQEEANYALDFNFTNQEGATVENIYNRFEVIGNILYCIVNMKLTNNSGSSITVYQISSGWKYISASIGNKIVDLEGKKVSESRTNACLICAHDFATTSNPNDKSKTNLSGILIFENEPDSTGCALICRWDSGLTIPDGESRWVTGRLFLTLL